VKKEVGQTYELRIVGMRHLSNTNTYGIAILSAEIRELQWIFNNRTSREGMSDDFFILSHFAARVLTSSNFFDLSASIFQPSTTAQKCVNEAIAGESRNSAAIFEAPGRNDRISNFRFKIQGFTNAYVQESLPPRPTGTF
jgi:hypothetical protein